MRKCVKCNHESDNDVNCYTTHDIKWRLHHHWYCKKCQQEWFVVEEPKDEATSFPFGLAAK